MTGGFLLRRISSGVIALLLGSTGALAQAPAQPKADRQELMQYAFDILESAMRIRTVPVDGFQIPGEQRNWHVKLEKYGGVMIITYSTVPDLAFRVQTYSCEDKVLKATGHDATVLGATETAAAFYKANTSFLSFDGFSEVLACALSHMAFDQSGTNDPKVKWVTSHSRAIRHMSNWMRFLRDAGDLQRAADFFSTILEEEKKHLEELAVNKDHSEEAGALQLFDELLPRKDFLPATSLSADQRAAVARYLEAAVQSRDKLRIFAPDLGKDMARDQELLRQYR